MWRKESEKKKKNYDGRDGELVVCTRRSKSDINEENRTV